MRRILAGASLPSLVPVAVAGIATGMTVVDSAGAPTWAAISMLCGFGWSGIATIRRSRQLEGRERIGWRLVGGGLSMAAVGLLVFAALETIVGNLPAYGPVDVFFVAAYLIVFVGLLALPHVGGSAAQRALTTVDGLVGSASIAVLFWTLGLSDALRSLSSAPLDDRILGSAYPLLDGALVIATSVMIIRRSSFRFDPRLVVLHLAFVIQMTADLSLLIGSDGGSLVDADAAFPLFSIAGFVMSMLGAAIGLTPASRAYPDRQAPWWTLFAPYAPAGILLVVYVSHLVTGDHAHLALLTYSLLGVALAIILRQALSIRQYRIRVEEERREMVSSLSHELRTPLTSVMGFLEFLDEPTLSREERAEMFEIVTSQIGYLSRIVCDLVILAREDPSAIALRPARLRLRSAIDGTIEAVEARHPEVRYANRVPAELMARLDPERLGQALDNLVVNASQYGAKSVEIVAQADDFDLTLEVHDDGPGVPVRHRVTIWERFERGVHKFDATVPGSGIGLSIVLAIAQAHGGDAAYRPSERLGGACFAVTIPNVVVPTLGGQPQSASDQELVVS